MNTECPRTGKKQYKSQRVAREELRKLRYKRKLQGWAPHAMEKTFYKCDFCSRYHLSSNRKTTYAWKEDIDEEGDVLESARHGREHVPGEVSGL